MRALRDGRRNAAFSLWTVASTSVPTTMQVWAPSPLCSILWPPLWPTSWHSSDLPRSYQLPDRHVPRRIKSPRPTGAVLRSLLVSRLVPEAHLSTPLQLRPSDRVRNPNLRRVQVCKAARKVHPTKVLEGLLKWAFLRTRTI